LKNRSRPRKSVSSSNPAAGRWRVKCPYHRKDGRHSKP